VRGLAGNPPGRVGRVEVEAGVEEGSRLIGWTICGLVSTYWHTLWISQVMKRERGEGVTLDASRVAIGLISACCWGGERGGWSDDIWSCNGSSP